MERGISWDEDEDENGKTERRSKWMYRRKYADLTETEKLLGDRELYLDNSNRRFPALLTRCFVLCFAMISLLFLMYIPVYNKANSDIGIVKGWSVHTNRNTKVYIQPENLTIIHQPNKICPTKSGNQLFLLVIVASSTVNFKQRQLIRDTWGKHSNYERMMKAFVEVRTINANYVPKSDSNRVENVVRNNTEVLRVKRNLVDWIPKIADAVRNTETVKEDDAFDEKVEKRFEDDVDEKSIPQFDMNDVIGDQDTNLDYLDDYPSNVMKIPPKGLEEQVDVKNIFESLKKSELFRKNASSYDKDLDLKDTKGVKLEVNKVVEPLFEVLFLVGLPSDENETETQAKIDNEARDYGDLIQEDFVDVYNNLTLKSVMLLKWVVKNCGDNVRYVMKTDDDVFVNMPNLLSVLKKKARINDAIQRMKNNHEPELMLMGDLITGAKPIDNIANKWYSPRYMYSGRIYPPYLSGTGYVLSSASVKLLYEAALVTPLFHLEDIYITGMCSAKTKPRLKPVDQVGFYYHRVKPNYGTCNFYSTITAHAEAYTTLMDQVIRSLMSELSDLNILDRCEKIRLDCAWAEKNKPKGTLHSLTKLVGLAS